MEFSTSCKRVRKVFPRKHINYKHLSLVGILMGIIRNIKDNHTILDYFFCLLEAARSDT